MAKFYITVSRAEALNGLTDEEIERLITKGDICSSVRAFDGEVKPGSPCGHDATPRHNYPLTIRPLELDGEGQVKVMGMIDLARDRGWPDQIVKDIIEGSGLPNDKETYVWY